jgi:hypothetical protein
VELDDTHNHATHQSDTAPVELRRAPEHPDPYSSGVWPDTQHATPELHGTVLPPGHHVYTLHPAYQPLPLHVAALIDHRDLPRPEPEILALIRHYHLWPAIGSCTFSAAGWWAHLEPDHIWLMVPFLLAGIFAPAAGWLAHHLHGADADRHITRSLIVGGAVGMSGAAAIGAGLSGISAMTTLLLAAIGTLGSIDWRRHRRQADRDFIVDYHEAVAGAPMPPAPTGGTPIPSGPLAVPMQSDEAHRLSAAFAAIGVPGIRIDAIRRSGEQSWLTWIYTPESRTVNARWLAARTDTLRTNLGCRSIQIIPTAIGNRWEIRVQDGTTSPLEETAPWPGPNTTTIKNPINIGIDETGKPVSFRLRGRHTLYAGITDGGKSVGVNVATCSVASMTDAVMVLLDLKPGQLELGPYEPVAYKSAAGVADAALLLKALVAAMEARGQILREERERTGMPVREWDPDVHGPVIVVIIDELAEMLRLDPKLFALWITLMQVARALGIVILGATQSPSSKALGGTTDGSGQFTNIASYRTKSATQTNVIHGPGAHGEGWRADETVLPLPGMFRPRTPEYPRPTIARGYMIEPEQIVATVEANRNRRPTLDARTAEAMEKVLKGRCNPQGPGGPAGPTGPGRPDDEDHETDSVDAAEAFHAGTPHLRVVHSRYPDGADADDLADAWQLFRTLGSATIAELQAHRLPGLTARDSCKAALNQFKIHGGASSRKDTDGRSERFVCTVPVPRQARKV